MIGKDEPVVLRSDVHNFFDPVEVTPYPGTTEYRFEALEPHDHFGSWKSRLPETDETSDSLDHEERTRTRVRHQQ